MDSKPNNRFETGIDKLKAWFSAIGSPVTLAETGIPKDAIDALADNAHGFAQSLGIDQVHPIDISCKF